MSRPNTRSQDNHHLSVAVGIGRGNGSRSPSPARVGQEDAFFPAVENQNPIMNTDEVRRIAMAAAEAATTAATATAVREAAAAAAEAAIAAMQRPTAPCTSRKPELPQFDKQNVEVWLKRVEGAFARASITTAKDKFFFLEPRFDVNFNPKVNEFLFGPATDEAWTNFVEYLKEEYGQTKEQQASTFLSGIRRDSRRPSQHLAYINDRTNKISLDDLKKEMILRDLPQEIRRALSSRTDTMNAEETAKAADGYFDKEGKVKFSSASAVINEINEAEETDGDINAINNHSRRPPPRTFPARKPIPSSTGQSFSRQTKTPAAPATKPKPSSANHDDSLCWYHNEFGAKAQKCEVGCKYKPKQGNAQAGRRM